MSQPNQNNNHNFRDTKIFVGGLAWRTTTDELRRSFQQFGEVIDANVVSEGLPGGNLRSKGYGFVVFTNAESANRACQFPLVVDGRQTNVNMAYLGAKNNSNQSNQNGLLNQAGPSHQYQNGLFNQAASHQYQLASHNPSPHFPPPYWAPYYGHHPYMYNVPCYSYPTVPTAMVDVQMQQHVLEYRMQRNWQLMNNIQSVTITNPLNEKVDGANEEVDEADEEADEADEEIDEPNEEVDGANEEVDEADEEINEANEEINEANEAVNEGNEEIIEANEEFYGDIEEIIEKTNEEDADTETVSDQEGEISGKDNDIDQDVNDQVLEIMSGEDDTKQEVDVTKHLGNGVEVTLQSEIICEEEAENTPQENGNGHEENGDEGEEIEEQEYIKERVREAI